MCLGNSPVAFLITTIIMVFWMLITKMYGHTVLGNALVLGCTGMTPTRAQSSIFRCIIYNHNHVHRGQSPTSHHVANMDTNQVTSYGGILFAII